jgi:ribose/xylose/arabinose/galactoside ABC-type transport system permease subunit
VTARADAVVRGRLRSLADAGVAWSVASRYGAVLLLLVGSTVYFAVSENGFLTSANVENLLTSVSILWVASMWMT